MSPEVQSFFKQPKKRKKLSQTAQADILFSKLIRLRGRCEIEGCDKPPELQCAHGFSRQYRAVRWDERNAFCLCKSHHFWYTPRPIQWEDWMRAKLGDALYEELRELAKTGKNPKLPEVLAGLKQRAAQMGLAA